MSVPGALDWDWGRGGVLGEWPLSEGSKRKLGIVFQSVAKPRGPHKMAEGKIFHQRAAGEKGRKISRGGKLARKGEHRKNGKSVLGGQKKDLLAKEPSNLLGEKMCREADPRASPRCG